jgi:hypothetical protein
VLTDSHFTHLGIPDGRFRMKWVLENAAKLIGLLSFALVVFSTVHDWGYFSIIGPHFRTLLSAYDYVTNAIEWMPAFIFWLAVSGALAYLMSSWFDHLPERGYGDHRRKVYRRTLFWYSECILIVSLGVLGFSLFFQTFPKSRETQIISATLVLTAFIGLYVAANNTKLEIRRLLVGAMGALGLAAAAYTTGTREARSAIEQPANVYKLNLKGDQTKSVVLLRTFEKGILIWNSDRHTAEMLRWDQLDGLSHIVAFDNVPAGCRIFSWFCQPQVEP